MSKTANKDENLEVTLGLLRAVENDAALTQRSVAKDLGVALGLVNAYLKRCIGKGLVKVRQAPNRRYAYYLTPQGFAEKSRLTAEFLSQSLNLFRQAKSDYSDLLEICRRKGWKKIAIVGAGDLTEIVVLLAGDDSFEFVVIGEPAPALERDLKCPMFARVEDVHPAPDAVIVSVLENPQAVYDGLVDRFPADRILVPKLLDVSVGPTGTREAGE